MTQSKNFLYFWSQFTPFGEKADNRRISILKLSVFLGSRLAFEEFHKS